jgi:hypothetical protein
MKGIDLAALHKAPAIEASRPMAPNAGVNRCSQKGNSSVSSKCVFAKGNEPALRVLKVAQQASVYLSLA